MCKGCGGGGIHRAWHVILCGGCVWRVAGVNGETVFLQSAIGSLHFGRVGCVLGVQWSCGGVQCQGWEVVVTASASVGANRVSAFEIEILNATCSLWCGDPCRDCICLCSQSNAVCSLEVLIVR